MRVHLYEFRSQAKKISCICGWERTLKSTSPEAAYKKFEQHRANP
ncbi:MAG TPA: hypothetical protein VNI01_00125 [Elusimicrobiota bacterium]|jgi:hypothetical protein|nr:hypothetical protein [Elusimicrobiota bacterium]